MPTSGDGRYLLISSLANVSNGEPSSVLPANLNTFSQLVASLHHLGTISLNFTPLNDSAYDSGTYLSWNTSDIGVSSAYVNFTLRVYGVEEDIDAAFAVNVTTTITISGSYATLLSGEKQVNLTCRVYNEDEPALAKNMTFFYENSGNWTQVDASNNLFITDQGNGTYLVSFTVDIPSGTVPVSVHVYDSRDVFVLANTPVQEPKRKFSSRLNTHPVTSK